MNEQLQKALAEIIQKSMNGLDTAVTFLSSEIPDVIHQLLLWYAVKYGIEMLFGLALLAGYIAAAIWGFRKAHAYESGEGYHEGVAYFLFATVAGVVGIATFITTTSFINIQWLQILVAPKIWLIEYAAKLVK